MNVNLPDSLEQSSFHTREPFEIFEMDKFLSSENYEELIHGVNETHLPNEIYEPKGNKKKNIVNGENYSNFPGSPFKKLIKYFLSEEFFEWFVKTHLFDKDRCTEPVYIYDKSKVNIEQIRKEAKSTGIERKFYETVVHYSSIRKNDFIPPHTDSKQKRLSFVLYLPSEELSLEMQKGLGTVFYKPRKFRRAWRNYDSGLLSERKTRKFFNKYEIAHISLFKPNRCVGFIKNDISWHAVAPNNFDYDRRAIVINVMEL